MSTRHRLGPTVLVSLLALAACGGRQDLIVSPAEADGSTGVLAGRATRWPPGPVQQRPGAEAAPGVAGLRILVAHGDGRPAATATTNAQGEFRIRLPAGTYQIALGGLQPTQSVKNLPRTVTVQPGTETRLDILIDTGVR
jgi:hypothetical protein